MNSKLVSVISAVCGAAAGVAVSRLPRREQLLGGLVLGGGGYAVTSDLGGRPAGDLFLQAFVEGLRGSA